MKSPEQIVAECWTQYCTPDEYESKVKAAMLKAMQAEHAEIERLQAELDKVLHQIRIDK